MTAEDEEKAATAVDGLYDRARGIVAIVILADVKSKSIMVKANAPNADLVRSILAIAALESHVTGRTVTTIEIDE